MTSQSGPMTYILTSNALHLDIAYAYEADSVKVTIPPLAEAISLAILSPI